MSNLLEPTEVARRLGIVPATLAKWRFEGRGPAFVKIGSRVRYPAAVVDKWLAARPLQQSTADGRHRRSKRRGA